MIPKIIHFIYPWTEKTRPWSLVNTISVKSAIDLYPDHSVFIWTNKPHLIPYLPGSITRLCELPTHVGGIEIVWPQYVSDVMRLQILLKHGGIYMDTDIINLRPFTPTDEKVLTLSWETSKADSISNAMMTTPPNNLFISQWLEGMPEAVTNPTWAYGGVVLPKKLSLNPFLEDQRVILSNKLCCPLDLSKNWMFDPKLKDAAKEKIADAYSVHIFETFWRDIVKDITPEWIDKNDCLFSELFKIHHHQ
jgi:hypothetical protein